MADPELDNVLARLRPVDPSTLTEEDHEKIEAIRDLTEHFVRGLWAILPEQSRYRALAMTEVEKAETWAVKGVTHKS